jgi:hypothetical protein
MNRKNYIATAVAVASLVLLLPTARAEDFLHAEIGLGFGIAKDMGNGTWIQDGLPDNHEKLTFPAVEAGITGTLWARNNWDLRYHLDYAYLGEQSASVDGVPDDQYNPSTHKVTMPEGERLSPFNGHGHVQGVPLTLDIGYTYRGWRFGAEAGAWVYWQTWHESLYNLDDQWQDLSHKTVAQVGFVAGASIERGPFSLSYRYYQISARWNPFPGLATGAHVLMARYRF